MGDTPAFASIPGVKSISLLSSEKSSISDMEGMTETQVQERMNAPLTSGGSTDDSHGLSMPECDSIEVKLTSTSRWASVQEALEACLDPFFLAGQSNAKSDQIVEELIQLLDTSLTVHVPALVDLSFIQPFFSDHTRSERLDAVLGAARASNKLKVRSDLPVPSSNGLMLSVDEAEAAGLRVGPRSHAEGVNRSVLSLERKQHGAVADSEESMCALTLSSLQATVPQHRIVKVEHVELPCAVRVVFVSPTAADRAYAVWRVHAPHADFRVTRVGGGGAPSAKGLPVPPRTASEAARTAGVGAAALTAPAAPAARTALKCPRVVGEALSCPSSSDNVSDIIIKAANTCTAATPSAAVSALKPPPAIDVVLPISSKAGTSAAASSGPGTTSTTPSPESSTAKSKFNMNAAPFLPKSVLDAQLAAATVGSPAAGWWGRGSRTRGIQGCEDVSSASMDTSEALANQILMDSSSGWMFSGLSPYAGLAWAKKFSPMDGWVEGGGTAAAFGMCSDMPTLSSTSARKKPPAMPERPRAVGGDMPVAPCALGDSPRLKELRPVGGVKGCSDPYAPHPVTMSLSPEQVSGYHGALDDICTAHTSQTSQTSPANLSALRRHRHDPYNATGFVVCIGSSCASSLSYPMSSACATPASSKLLCAGSSTSERAAAGFCFQDPLIKASARRRERHRQMQEEESAARTSSSEADISSSHLEGMQSPQTEGSRSSIHSNNGSADRVTEQHSDEFAACSSASTKLADVADAIAAEPAGASAAAESAVPAPRSYAEALRLKAKAHPAAAAISTKSPERRREMGKANGASAAAAPAARFLDSEGRKAVAPAKSLSKPKKLVLSA
ncbi:hypothetical protein ABL78_6395 [Leptomonas seymouri]|uniref:Uncharacterized protein n=1 Tax=Leptomonas seymouri TaxID=5684 RepID=A0A0N1PC13_LEPSE|nr:hypothetical protein ABL78_6395 [Leptomonas seymouri]|eukprot:KPI84554.1 hypothetical protein ABL78_6395 [Leptomonas seymouri]